MMTPGICESFLLELAKATHDFSTDTFKMALYTEDAVIGPDTTIYTATGEASGTNYTAGGIALTATATFPKVDSGKLLMDWADAVFLVVSLSARGALIYNSSKSNKAVMVIDFGLTYSPAGADFTVTMPIADASRAALRISGGSA